MWELKDYSVGTISWFNSYKRALSVAKTRLKKYNSKYWFKRGIHLSENREIIEDKDNQIIIIK